MDKLQHHNNRSQCTTCLSISRRLSSIGSYSYVYLKLMPDGFNQGLQPIEKIELCWECLSLLRRVAKFQSQVQKAHSLIKNGQSHVCGTLSSLTSVVRSNDQVAIYSNATNIAIKNEDIDNRCSGNEDLDSLHQEEDYDEHNNEALPKENNGINIMKHEIKSPKSKESTKFISKWAQKRAMQNRKPKFKILKADDLIVDAVFRKVDNIKHTIRKLECIKCDLRFAKEDRLMKHFTEAHKKDYFCDVCLAMLPDKSILLSHMKAHSDQYACTLCDYVSKNGHQRRKHLMKMHPQIFQCVKCELKFPSRVDFYQHFKEWHEKFTCDYCGITFKMKYCIKDHIRKKHSPFECKPCNKRFARYNGLWLHNKVRHGPPAAAAYCVECDKRYPDAYRYKWHLANSIRHKPRRKVRVPCPDCGKVFSKKIYMKDHYNLVHLKQYKYRCEDCNKNFVRNADLVKHKRRIHDGILPPKNKICYMCGRGFTTNKILTNHLRTHTGERPFACVSCPARFAQRAALAGHVRALHHSCA